MRIYSRSQVRISSDNTAVEAFYATLKNELVYHELFPTREIAKTKIFENIEMYFNQTRIHSFLQNLTPNEFEKIKNAA
ncbi:IS3 family transposase [candidate division KSB1 bacterium]|nr:IS3 family transposase [candidate division KSB1 bacterium]